MQLTIRDLTFPITSARLSAGMWDPYWSAKWNGGVPLKPTLSLELDTAPVTHGDTPWQPKLYHDALSFPARDWRAIAGQRLTWHSAHDTNTGAPNGCMYVFLHSDVHEAELNFGARNGMLIDIEWRGLCDVFGDRDRYGARVPFSATAQARFTDVHLHGSAKDDAASFRNRFAQHLNPDDFDQGPVIEIGHCYDDGMKMASCVFTPRGGQGT